MNSSSRVGAIPMSAAATAAGTSSIGIRPWKVSRSAIPSAGAPLAERSLAVATAVELEADVQIGTVGASRATASTTTSSS